MVNTSFHTHGNTQTVLAERALMVIVREPEQTQLQYDSVVGEMKRLAKTAHLETVEIVSQQLKEPNPRTLIGRGKVDEIAEIIAQGPEIDAALRGKQNRGIDIVVFGCDLSPVHQRNLEKLFSRRVIDRSELILDIFAQHAVTRDGKIQVELAQLEYLKPRLTGRGVDLSRLGGGIGTRGPGETKLEIDRRKIGERIRKLRNEYEKCRSVGKTQRQNRKRDGAINVAMVGYTNAGKSTILNRLTKSKVEAEDSLFCTLDTTTRRLFLLDGTKLLLSDTVGFIEDLPAPLLGAFRATLAEVEEADALIHVLDVSSPDAERHVEAVMGILKDMDVIDKPILTIMNKVDAVEDEQQLRYLQRVCEPAIPFSALQEKDLIPLFEKLKDLSEEYRSRVYQSTQTPVSV